MSLPRWPNQIAAFDGFLDAQQRGVKRLLITSPTGSGKTFMFFDVMAWANENSKNVILFTQRKMLFDQLCRNMDAAGISYGKRAAGHEKALLRTIQIAMTQSELSAVYKAKSRELHPADIILIDEAHQTGGERFNQIMEDHVSAGGMKVGYTATPLDCESYDELLVAGTPSECIRIGALVPPCTFAPDEPDLRKIKNYKVGVDLTESQQRQAIMRPGVVDRVIDAWRRHNPDWLPSLGFGPDVKGSLYFAEQFSIHGIPAAHIDGEQIWIEGEFYPSSQETRDQVAAMSKSGEIKIVWNRFVLREGIDWPWIRCGSFACVFGSLTSFLQSGGRLLRAHPEKDRAIILDHGGNWHRHGSLAEDRNWELSMTNVRAVASREENIREHRAPEPIVCAECKRPRATGKKCPYCGYETHIKSRIVVQADGTLRHVEGDIYKPRRRVLKETTVALWNRMYHRARSEKWNASFRQAEAMFVQEHHHWPPRDLPLMPKNPDDWFRRVRDVPREALI